MIPSNRILNKGRGKDSFNIRTFHKEARMADYDGIIIGSGAGGLSAALKLARCNHKVLLLEAMPFFGGYLNPFRRKGYTFDTGLHYLGELGRGDRFWRSFDELGVIESLAFIELNPDGFDRYVFPDYELRVCKEKEQFIERLTNYFPREQRGIHEFFSIFDKIIRAGNASESMGQGALNMLGFILRHPVMMKYSRVPYQKLLDSVTSDRKLQAALAAPCGNYGLPPAQASTIIAVAVWAHYLKGAYYPRGGSGMLRDVLVKGLEDHGAELKRNSRVVSIDKRGAEFLITTESGERYTARAVISDADPVITLGTLVNQEMVPTRIKRKEQRMRPSGSAFYAFIGTDLDLPSVGVTDANIIHYSGYDINALFKRLTVPVPPEDFPMFFITSPSVKDPEGGHAPEGHHTVEIITGASYQPFERWAQLPSTKRGEEYQGLKEKIGERLISAAERYIPDLSKHIDFVEYATPLSSEYWVNAVHGGNFGPDQTPDQVGLGRFMTFSAGISGLFLAGAGTIGGGVMPCIESGIRAGGKAATYLESS
jgi:phytoene dehydrogenase-like protein